MMEIASFLHYLAVALMTTVSTIGVGLGQGAVSLAAIEAINIQPKAQGNIIRIAVFGMVLIEFAAIAGVTFALFLLFTTTRITLFTSIAEMGIAIAIAISGFMVGLACYFPAKEAALAIARQPFFAQNILRFMLLTQSIIQTPVVFAFIVGMFIKNQSSSVTTLPESIRLLASGLCIGLGTIGPALGLSYFAKKAVRGAGLNRNAYNTLLSFTFISQAIIETPMLFSLLISLFLLTTSVNDNVSAMIALLSAALCAGIGTFGPGISSGKTAAAAVEQIAINPAHYGTLSKTSMFGQGLIDSSAIYAFLIALLLYFFK